jgi:host factor-I protein
LKAPIVDAPNVKVRNVEAHDVDTRVEARDILAGFLADLREKAVPVSVYLVNGLRLRGRIDAFDPFVLRLADHAGIQLIYKHAVSTVIPADEAAQGAAPARPAIVTTRKARSRP